MSLFLILLFFYSPPASATIQFVQQATANNQNTQNTTLSVSLSNTAAGNLLVAYVTPLPGQVSSISVADGVNTYSAAASTFVENTGCGNLTEEFFYAANIRGGNVTVTATINVATGMGLTVLEYSGVATTAPLDAQAGTSNTGCPYSGTPTSASLTTTNANDLIVSGATLTAPDTWTAGTGYGLRTGTSGPSGVEDLTVSSTGTYTGTFGLSTNGNWTAAVVAFKAAGSTSAGTPTCGISNDSSIYAPADTDWANPPVLAQNVAKGGHYTDPKFGCTVTRITDVSTEDFQQSCNGGSGCLLPIQHGYSLVSPFNANDTYLMLVDGWGWHFVTDLQGNIVVPGCDMILCSPTNGMPNSNGYLLWDASNPNVFYYTYQDTTVNPPNGVGALAKATISGSSVSTTTLARFSQYPTVALTYDADVSQDGAHVVIVGGSLYVSGAGSTCGYNTTTNKSDYSGCGPEYVFVYNLATNTVESSPGTYTTTCKAPVGTDGKDTTNGIGCIHRVLLTPDNNVIINFVNDGSALEQGYRLWAGTTTDNSLCASTLCHLQDNTDHLDVGYDLTGNAVFIEEGGSSIISGESNPCTSGSGLDVRQIYTFTNGIPSSAYCLLDNQPSYHVSYRGSSSQPWAAPSFFDLSSPPNASPEYFNNPYAPNTCGSNHTSPCFVPPSQQWGLYQDEIMLTKIVDGSTFYRLARAYSRSAENYNANPKASISRDGKYIAFDSNMAYVNGCPTNFQDTTSCSDVYIVKVQ